MSLVSSINQLRTAPKPTISLLPNGQVVQLKVLRSISSRHDLKSPIATFWSNDMAQNIAQVQWIDRWISSQLFKSQLYTEKSNFDFLVKIKCQRSQFIKKCQNVKLVHQEIKDWRYYFEIWNFHNLENFQSIENFLFFLNFRPNFHHDTRWFKKNFQHESCRS